MQVQAHSMDQPQSATGGDAGEGIKCGLGCAGGATGVQEAWCAPAAQQQKQLHLVSKLAVVTVLVQYSVSRETAVCRFGYQPHHGDKYGC